MSDSAGGSPLIEANSAKRQIKKMERQVIEPQEPAWLVGLDRPNRFDVSRVEG